MGLNATNKKIDKRFQKWASRNGSTAQRGNQFSEKFPGMVYTMCIVLHYKHLVGSCNIPICSKGSALCISIASSIKTRTIGGIVLCNKLYILVRPFIGQPKAHCSAISILISYICEVDGTLTMKKCSLTQIQTDFWIFFKSKIGILCTYKMF